MSKVTVSDAVAWVLCALAFAFGAWGLQVGWNHGILDVHAWRQSHTAISVQEMLRGGPFWHYRTPIFGPPWQWPLEFPIYQWLVAVFTRVFGTALEPTGRAVAVAFFLGTLGATWVALELFEIAPRHRPIVLALLSASPIYVFWSRTFMMESAALFFAVAYAASVHRATRATDGGQSKGALVAAALAGALAGATKVTTLVPFLAGAAMLAALRWRRGGWTRQMTTSVVVAAFAIPLLATLGWLAFVDVQKATNPLAAALIWAGERDQRFGSVADRLVARNWYASPANAILGRTQHTVVASAWVLSAACLALAAQRRRLALCAACGMLYVLPIAIFMPLFVAHVYYGYENGIFLIVVLGCGIVACLEGPLPARIAGVTLFAAALSAMSANYLRGYYQNQASGDLAPMTLGLLTRQMTSPSDVMLIYGLAYSPALPYSAERRAIMDWRNLSVDDAVIRVPLERLAAEGARVGAVVVCGTARAEAIVRANIATLGFPQRPVHTEDYCDLYLKP